MNETIKTSMLKIYKKLMMDIEQKFKDKKYYTNIIESEDNTGCFLVTNDFLLFLDYEKVYFVVSFHIKCKPTSVALSMKYIMEILDSEELYITDEYCINEETMEFIYGNDASEYLINKHLKKLNKEKCIVCNQVFPEEIVKNGICLLCEGNKFLWN